MVRLVVDTEDKKSGWNHAGDVSVDSGRIMIADPCSLDSQNTSLSKLVDAVIPVDFEKMCSAQGMSFDNIKHNLELMEQIIAKRKTFGEGQFPGGKAQFVGSETGYGDGLYPVFAKVEGKRIVGLWIDFGCGEHWPDDEEE